MDIVAVAAIATFLLAVAGTWFIAEPFTQVADSEQEAALRDGGDELQNLVAQKDRLFIQLEELEASHNAGQIGVPEFQAQRAALLQEAGACLQRLAALGGLVVEAAPKSTPMTQKANV